MVISSKRVSLLTDQLFRILWSLFILSEKVICEGVSSKVENHTPNAYTLSLAHNIGFEEARVISELLQEPIHRASVFSSLTLRPKIRAKVSRSEEI